MKDPAVKFIVNFLWALFLFGLWIMLSLYKGTEAEWWSMFSINPEKDLSMALEFSLEKITFAAVLSVTIAYFINGFLWRKEK